MSKERVRSDKTVRGKLGMNIGSGGYGEVGMIFVADLKNVFEFFFEIF
ncbi:hypothetical protein AAKU67_004107 [Oxalobacteraceae bacterium GrIS 2.11]